MARMRGGKRAAALRNERRRARNADLTARATPEGRVRSIAERAVRTGRSTRSTGNRLLFPTNGTGRTPQQIVYDNDSANMRKNWLPQNLGATATIPARPNLQPRGIVNPGNHCYLSSVLQSFMHMPQFLHWIRGHQATANCMPVYESEKKNSKSKRERTNPKVNNTKPEDNNIKPKNDIAKPENNGTEPKNPIVAPKDRVYLHGPCICCHIKGLVEEYWGPTDPSNPIPLTSPSLTGMKAFTFQNINNGNQRKIPGTEDYQDVSRFESWRQEDAHEALTFLLQHMTVCDPRTQQFDAMFRACIASYHTCSVCGDERLSNTQDDTALLVTIDEDTQTTIEDAISWKLEKDPGPPSMCLSSTCNGADTDKHQVWRLRAAPRILNITLNIFNRHYKTGMPIKKMHALTLGSELDLTRHQEAKGIPLIYRLSTVVSHNGADAVSGHYVASVRSQGANPFYNINDSTVHPFDQPRFVANPQRPPRTGGGRFQAYILTCILDEGPLERFLESRDRERLVSSLKINSGALSREGEGGDNVSQNLLRSSF